MGTRHYEGRIPDTDQWRHITDVGKYDGFIWSIFVHPGNKGWWNVKIAANGRVPHKANYSTAWNGERLARSRDAGFLIANRPELAQEVENQLKSNLEQPSPD